MASESAVQRDETLHPRSLVKEYVNNCAKAEAAAMDIIAQQRLPVVNCLRNLSKKDARQSLKRIDEMELSLQERTLFVSIMTDYITCTTNSPLLSRKFSPSMIRLEGCELNGAWRSLISTWRRSPDTITTDQCRAALAIFEEAVNVFKKFGVHGKLPFTLVYAHELLRSFDNQEGRTFISPAEVKVTKPELLLATGKENKKMQRMIKKKKTKTADLQRSMVVQNPSVAPQAQEIKQRAKSTGDVSIKPKSPPMVQVPLLNVVLSQGTLQKAESIAKKYAQCTPKRKKSPAKKQTLWTQGTLDDAGVQNEKVPENAAVSTPKNENSHAKKICLSSENPKTNAFNIMMQSSRAKGKNWGKKTGKGIVSNCSRVLTVAR